MAARLDLRLLAEEYQGRFPDLPLPVIFNNGGMKLNKDNIHVQIYKQVVCDAPRLLHRQGKRLARKSPRLSPEDFWQQVCLEALLEAPRIILGFNPERAPNSKAKTTEQMAKRYFVNILFKSTRQKAIEKLTRETKGHKVYSLQNEHSDFGQFGLKILEQKTFLNPSEEVSLRIDAVPWPDLPQRIPMRGGGSSYNLDEYIAYVDAVIDRHEIMTCQSVNTLIDLMNIDGGTIYRRLTEIARREGKQFRTVLTRLGIKRSKERSFPSKGRDGKNHRVDKFWEVKRNLDRMGKRRPVFLEDFRQMMPSDYAFFKRRYSNEERPEIYRKLGLVGSSFMASEEIAGYVKNEISKLRRQREEIWRPHHLKRYSPLWGLFSTVARRYNRDKSFKGCAYAQAARDIGLGNGGGTPSPDCKLRVNYS